MQINGVSPENIIYFCAIYSANDYTLLDMLVYWTVSEFLTSAAFLFT